MGVPHLDTMNVALLTKWVKRIVGQEDDLIKFVMRDRYGIGLAWEKFTANVSGASALWRGLSEVVPRVQQFFSAQLGDGATFQFWLDNWSASGCLRDIFPRLFALTRCPKAVVGDCWFGGWSPTFTSHLSDQRVEEFLSLLMLIISERLVEGMSDGWT